MVELSNGAETISAPIYPNGRDVHMRKVMYFLTAALLMISISGVVLAASAQPNAPLLSIASPINGSTISGDQVTIAVNVNSSERLPVAKVRVFLDGQAIVERVFETPSIYGTCSFQW